MAHTGDYFYRDPLRSSLVYQDFSLRTCDHAVHVMLTQVPYQHPFQGGPRPYFGCQQEDKVLHLVLTGVAP